MTILDLQRRIAEVGRLRIGQQVPTNNGKTRPVKLDTWRVTSQDRQRIQAIADLYGGQPQEWQAPSGAAWEVITETDSLPIIVPPSYMAFSMFYEQWGSGGCLRRCDGAVEQLSDKPCPCDPDNRDCDIHTRLSVMLRDVPGLGVYRLDSSGYYAAVELQGAVEVVAIAAARGTMIPARLRLEQRQIKRQGEPRRDFAVPVLDLEVSPAQLLGGQMGAAELGGARYGGAAAVGGGAAALAELPAGDGDEPLALLTPVPDTVPERPVAPVADQARAAGQPTGTKRAGAATAIPRTGLKPRTAAQAEAGQAPDRDEPEGAAPISGEDLEGLNVGQLKTRLKAAGLPVSGNKSELIARLEEHTSGSSNLPEGGKTGNSDPADDTPPPPDDPDDDQQPAVGADTPGTVTDKQKQRLAILMRELGIRGDGNDDLYRASMRALYDVDSVKGLSAKQASGLIRVLDQGRTPLGGAHEPPEVVAASFLRAGEQLLAREEQEGPAGLRKRMHDALRSMTSEHEAYPEVWERLQSLLEGDGSVEWFAAADRVKLEELVVDAEKIAAEVDDE